MVRACFWSDRVIDGPDVFLEWHRLTDGPGEYLE
jgi:hypothetical protein